MYGGEYVGELRVCGVYLCTTSEMRVPIMGAGTLIVSLVPSFVE